MEYTDKNIIEETIGVDSDPKASYHLLDLNKNPLGNIEILTVRNGPSGVSYAAREVQETPFRCRYLAEGESPLELLQNMKTRKEDSFWELVEGSIPDVISQFAIERGREL